VPALLGEERRARILEALGPTGMLSTENLARRLNVSPETIRRDLVQLEGERLLRRVHGGATRGPAVRGEEAPYRDRAESAAAAKRRIGELAAGLVRPGQTVIFDVGTTTLAAARALPSTFRGTVVTCSLLVAAELAGRSGVELLVAGGRVRGGDLAVSNAYTVSFFADLHADVAFLGSGGVSADAGLTDYYVDEVATRRVMIAHADATYVLADSSKLGQVAAHRVCGLDEVTAVVTDHAPPAPLAADLRAAGGTVLSTP
jgi:DeoR/GlpR family transcriptional regulator of sugar metabolism